jgi:predicted alpha/beta-hydrolase family hydrolase
VLSHGAGGNCQSPLLVALADRFADNGMAVLRCDLPFRQQRPKGAPSPSGSQRDRLGLESALSVLQRIGLRRLFLGGQSYGGRQASMLAASNPSLVSGLLLLSYPLHPPGKPAQPRTQHFSSLRTPTLFVSGTKDAFGSVEELEAAIELILAPRRLLPIDGAGHSLLTRQNCDDLPNRIVEAFGAMFHPRA